MPERAVLFIDYQNAYRNALDLFHGGEPGPANSNGQFRPWDLGLAICRRHNQLHPAEPPLELSGVRVYRGQPLSRHDPRGYRAARRQGNAWRSRGVEIFEQPLAYDERSGRARGEKEVDVWLAVDLVTMAIDAAYDVAILFSADRDFRPALRYVRDRFTPVPRVDIAAWGTRRDRRALSIEGAPPTVHYVSRAVYESVRDPTNYAERRSSRRASRH